MAVDNTTNNVVSVVPVSTSPFTVDVSACNLTSDLSIKDFIVLINGTINSNVNWSKTSRTVLTYVGIAFPTAFSIEVRRRTPETRYQEMTYGTKLSTAMFEEELNRISRRAYEYTLNGVGVSSLVSSVAPSNEIYGASWSTDTIVSATRKALYDKIQTLSPIANPTFTGTPATPTPLDSDNGTTIVNSQWVNNRITNTLTGSPGITSPTISNPTLTGNPIGVTQPITDNDTSLATTAFAHLASVVKKIATGKATSIYTITTAGNWYDIANVTVTVTPRSVNSKFLVFATGTTVKAAPTDVERTRILVGTSTVLDEARAIGYPWSTLSRLTLIGFHSPNSVSPQTYRVQGYIEGGSITWGSSTLVNDYWSIVAIEYENTL